MIINNFYNSYGAVLTVAAAAAFTADVTILRYLDQHVPFSLIIFFRSISQLLIVSIWIALRPNLKFRSPRWIMLISRGVISLICWWLYYLSFKKLDLALASTLTFTTSLFVVTLAPIVLKEKLGWKRLLTSLIGFLGILLASEMKGFNINLGILMGLGSAFAAAVLTFQNRLLISTENTSTIMFWIGLVTTIGTFPAAAIYWVNVGITNILILSLAGLLGTLGMLMTVEAYRFGEVSYLAPFPYTRIIFALFVGYFLFEEIASLYEIIGAIIIIICGFIASEKQQPKSL